MSLMLFKLSPSVAQSAAVANLFLPSAAFHSATVASCNVPPSYQAKVGTGVFIGSGVCVGVSVGKGVVVGSGVFVGNGVAVGGPAVAVGKGVTVGRDVAVGAAGVTLIDESTPPTTAITMITPTTIQKPRQSFARQPFMFAFPFLVSLR